MRDIVSGAPSALYCTERFCDIVRVGGIVATRLTLTLSHTMRLFDEKPISIAVNGLRRRQRSGR